MKRLENRVALITGGASGMGEASVRRFIAEGARVVLADIDEDRGRAVAAEYGDSCVFVRCDHTKPADNEASVSLAVERFGKLDTLFNNAGIPFANDAIENVDDETLQRIIDVKPQAGLRSSIPLPCRALPRVPSSRPTPPPSMA